MADRPQLQVVQGPQAWRLIRTSRDGAAEDELPQMAAAAVRYFLLQGKALAGKGAKHELVAVGDNEWRFAEARPLLVLSVSKAPVQLPVGDALADRQSSVPGTVPTVNAPGGAQPWFINVEFWWRGAPMLIDYPGMSEGFFGRSFELNGADWVLDRAVAVPEQQDPGDETWGDAMGDRAADAAAEAGKEIGEVMKSVALPTGAIVVGGLVLYFLMTRRGGNG